MWERPLAAKGLLRNIRALDFEKLRRSKEKAALWAAFSLSSFGRGDRI